MKKIVKFLFAFVVFGFFVNVNASEKNHHSNKYKLGNIEIEGVYTFITPPTAKVAAGYMKIENEARKTDTLLSVTNISFAEKVEIHETIMENQVMKMRPLVDGLNITGDEEVYLKPSGFHIMFIGLKEPIVKGKMYKGTLNFKNAGSITVNFKAVDRGYHPDKDHHKHH